MACCPPELLDDLADLFAELRTWAGIVEKRSGVFYVGNQPFLHFHLLAGGERRADVKGRTSWAQLDLPRPVTAARRRAVLRELRIRHGEKAPAGSRAERRSSRPARQDTGARSARPGG